MISNGIQGEAREFAAAVNNKLDMVVDAIVALDTQVASDTQAVIRSHTEASDSEVVLELLRIPEGAMWHVQRVTVVSPSNLVPVLYLNGTTHMDALEAPFAHDDDTSPTFLSFRAGYTLRGPATLYARASGASGDHFHGLAVVTMLGGTGR